MEKDKTRILLLAIRRGLLIAVDGIEEYLEIKRTKDLRKIAKELRIQDYDA